MFFINEISPATDPEWVELYTSESASLQNCSLYLHDSEDTKQVITFSEGIKVENHFYVIKKGDFNWTSNWLNNSEDTVRIKCTDKEDKYTYSNLKGKTVGRNPDGIGEFYTLTESSEGTPNAPPTPAPTAKPTEVSQTTPLPTTDPPATTEPGVTITSAPPTSLTPVLPAITEQRTSRPSIETVQVKSTPVNKTLVERDESSASSFYAFIAIGVLFLFAGVFPFLKKIYNDTHAQNEKIP